MQAVETTALRRPAVGLLYESSAHVVIEYPPCSANNLATRKSNRQETSFGGTTPRTSKRLSFKQLPWRSWKIPVTAHRVLFYPFGSQP